jgi:pilus assembly protein CpaC
MRRQWALIVTLSLLVLSQGTSVLADGNGQKAAATVVAPSPKSEQGQTMVLYLRQSEVIKAPWPTKRVSVTDPKVADIKVLTPDQVLVQGIALGSTDLLMWSETDAVWRTKITVEMDLGRQTELLARLFPDCRLEVSQSDGSLVIQGTMARAQQVADLHRLMEATGVKYVDMTNVAGGHQVQINVRVAEVRRQSLREMGINIFHADHYFFGGSQVGSSTGGAINGVSIGPAGGTVATKGMPFTFNADVNVSSAVTLFAGFPKQDMQMFIQALAENQYLRILAEPTLVALSGEEATFLAGGEYPIPVVQGGNQTGTSITVEYREFGVRLRFKPKVTGEGTIQLYVAPEVSDLSYGIGATRIAGFDIPAVVTRKAATTIEMKSGQTFAMAGLINSNISSIASKVPLLGELPVLGPLFRSVRYSRGETELVVLVTVNLVQPLSLETRPPAPGVTHVAPSDWELYVDGQVEGRGPPLLSEADAAWLRKLGLDELLGPGGWAGYEQGSMESTAPIAAPQEPAAPPAQPAPAPAGAQK